MLPIKIWWWVITETRNSMSAGMSLCLIWIPYGYSWRSFFKILCNDARERPSSWEHLRKDIFGLLRIDSLTASTLSGHFADNILPDLGFFVEVVYWPCGLKSVYPTINLAFVGLIIKVKLPAKFCWPSFEWFCLQISCDVKYFSSPVQCIVIED